VDEHETTPAYRHLLALCYREKSARLAGPAAQTGAEERKEAVGLLRELTQQFPSVPEYRYDLCVTLAQQDVGFLFAPFPIPREQQKDYTEALRLAKALVAEHPNVPDYQITRSHIHMRLGHTYQFDKELDKAEAEYRQALQIHKTLAQRSPKVTFHHFVKARITETLSDVLVAQDKLDESRTLLESSIADLQKLAAQDENPRFLHWAQADAYRRLAKTLTALDEPELAAQASQQAKQISQSGKGPSKKSSDPPQ
jgi:tetratricopeptide (TPR) repeat protein